MRAVRAGIVGLAALWAVSAWGAEEKIAGVLEKTEKEGACCQIRDALKDLYYVAKSDEAVKMCADLIGKKVVVTGTVEKKGEDFFVTAKAVAEAPAIKAPLPEPPPKEAPKGKEAPKAEGDKPKPDEPKKEDPKKAE